MFLELTNIDTWDTALERFGLKLNPNHIEHWMPMFEQNDSLMKFKGSSLEKLIPPKFKEWVDRMCRDQTRVEAVTSSKVNTKKILEFPNNTKATVIEGSAEQIIVLLTENSKLEKQKFCMYYLICFLFCFVVCNAGVFACHIVQRAHITN